MGWKAAVVREGCRGQGLLVQHLERLEDVKECGVLVLVIYRSDPGQTQQPGQPEQPEHLQKLQRLGGLRLAIRTGHSVRDRQGDVVDR